MFPGCSGSRIFYCLRPGRRFSGRCAADWSTTWWWSAQFGQSIDARIATASGHSHYINGPEGLAHLHRLRALVDAVVDRRRHRAGRRSATDRPPRRRAKPGARGDRSQRPAYPRPRACWRTTASRRLVITRSDTALDLPAGIEVVTARGNRRADSRRLRFSPALAERGFRRILIEGGAEHGVALPRRRMPRPAARDDRADDHRRRPVEREPRADRAGRPGDQGADARAYPRRRSAARLRPLRSADRHRHREEIDVTDAHARRAGGDELEPSRQPVRNAIGRQTRQARLPHRAKPRSTSRWIA